ncbi:MAG: trimeric intracellular cation channel family protein [Myxococcota bacterium]
MDADLWLTILDRAGVLVFAMSGGVAAVRQDMDAFGVVALGFLPAVGGGTLRDVLLGEPVFWLDDTVTLWLALAGGLLAWFLHPVWERFRAKVWADAIGLAVFAALGADKALALGHPGLVVVIMGTLTATAGGLLRDVVANVTPLLLRQDIYATAALAGAAVLFGAHHLGLARTEGLLAGAAVTFVIRAAAIRFDLHAPRPSRDQAAGS